MPELPEVETIVADLRPHLVGRTIVDCDLRFPSMVRYPEAEVFGRSIPGARIVEARRRGKFIYFGLDKSVVPTPWGGGAKRRRGRSGTEQATGPSLLVVHLGMSGQLRLVDANTAFEKHTHVVFTLDDGQQLRYRDPRRFGRLLYGTESELLASGALPDLGPEPIDPGFGADDLYQMLHHRRAQLKALLLDQGAVAGVGNIYADESLYRARLRPDRRANTVTKKAAARLHQALRESLELGIANRGASVDTYRDAWGEVGGQQEELLVYGRAGEPCFNCGRPLSLVRIAGRSSVFCRRCQR